MADVQIFICDRGRKSAPPCKRCGERATVACEFPLRGEKKGQTCGFPLCDTHSYEASDPKTKFKGRVCEAHARLLGAQ